MKGEGEVVAVDARTGKVKWSQKLPGNPLGGATVVNDLVFTALIDGTVLALDRDTDGKIVWKYKAAGASTAGCRSRATRSSFPSATRPTGDAGPLDLRRRLTPHREAAVAGRLPRVPCTPGVDSDAKRTMDGSRGRRSSRWPHSAWGRPLPAPGLAPPVHGCTRWRTDVHPRRPIAPDSSERRLPRRDRAARSRRSSRCPSARRHRCHSSCSAPGSTARPRTTKSSTGTGSRRVTRSRRRYFPLSRADAPGGTTVTTSAASPTTCGSCSVACSRCRPAPRPARRRARSFARRGSSASRSARSPRCARRTGSSDHEQPRAAVISLTGGVQTVATFTGITVPLLLVHGDADHTVPYPASAFMLPGPNRRSSSSRCSVRTTAAPFDGEANAGRPCCRQGHPRLPRRVPAPGSARSLADAPRHRAPRRGVAGDPGLNRPRPPVLRPDRPRRGAGSVTPSVRRGPGPDRSGRPLPRLRAVRAHTPRQIVRLQRLRRAATSFQASGPRRPSSHATGRCRNPMRTDRFRRARRG